jgi:tRNA-splicing ligase RtcB
LDEPLGKEYWALHNSAANYAIANRHTMAAAIKQVFQDVFNADCHVHYEISHNLIQEETLVLPDGTHKKGLVHRKGATRAMPGGHPDLRGTPWQDNGHPCIVPGSMFEGAAVLRPLQGAHDWACSVNHGSGRVMARGAAKRKLEPKQALIDGEMHDVKRRFGDLEIEGVVCNTKHVPLDECARVYKSLDDVLQTLEDSGVAQVERRLYPLANLKGADDAQRT